MRAKGYLIHPLFWDNLLGGNLFKCLTLEIFVISFANKKSIFYNFVKIKK